MLDRSLNGLRGSAPIWRRFIVGLHARQAIA
jgi:hypothetical protein